MHLGTDLERRWVLGDGTMSMKVFFTVKLKYISSGSAFGQAPAWNEESEEPEVERGESKAPSMGS
jgi:hypothetical protein